MFNNDIRDLLIKALKQEHKDIIKELAKLINSDEETVYNSIEILKKIINKEVKKQGLSIGTALNILLKN